MSDITALNYEILLPSDDLNRMKKILILLEIFVTKKHKSYLLWLINLKIPSIAIIQSQILFGQYWESATPILYRAFLYANVHTKTKPLTHWPMPMISATSRTFTASFGRPKRLRNDHAEIQDISKWWLMLVEKRRHNIYRAMLLLAAWANWFPN